MKNKIKSRYIKQINDLMDSCKGWPLSMLIADRHVKYEQEHRYYLEWKKYSMTKKGKESGAYFIDFGKHPSRLSHGHKHGSFVPTYNDYLS